MHESIFMALITFGKLVPSISERNFGASCFYMSTRKSKIVKIRANFRGAAPVVVVVCFDCKIHVCLKSERLGQTLICLFTLILIGVILSYNPTRFFLLLFTLTSIIKYDAVKCLWVSWFLGDGYI